MLGLHRDKVELAPYNSEWAEEFKCEKAILEKLLGDYALAIEHVGSTSIEGLSAKPMLDMAVGVKDIATMRKLIPLMDKHGYDPLDSIDEKGELLGRKGAPEMRTHLIHIEVLGSEYWNNHIMFRDYLRAHPQAVKEYEELKHQLAKTYKDERRKYTAAKNDFIQNILKLAKEERA